MHFSKKIKLLRICFLGSEYIHRKSIIRRPSHNLPDGLWKNVRPVGRPNLRPSPSEKPPVSEFESPKLKITGFWLQ